MVYPVTVWQVGPRPKVCCRSGHEPSGRRQVHCPQSCSIEAWLC